MALTIHHLPLLLGRTSGLSTCSTPNAEQQKHGKKGVPLAAPLFFSGFCKPCIRRATAAIPGASHYWLGFHILSEDFASGEALATKKLREKNFR